MRRPPRSVCVARTSRRNAFVATYHFSNQHNHIISLLKLITSFIPISSLGWFRPTVNAVGY